MGIQLSVLFGAVAIVAMGAGPVVAVTIDSLQRVATIISL